MLCVRSAALVGALRAQSALLKDGPGLRPLPEEHLVTQPAFDLLELATPYALHAISDTERATIDREEAEFFGEFLTSARAWPAASATDCARAEVAC